MHDLSRDAAAQLLVVDDEPLVRDLLARWLRDGGYACATAGSPAAALAHLQAHPVDLAKLDISMAGGSGLDLLDQIRQTIHRLVRASLYRDEETGAHIKRTGWYGELLAATIGWKRKPVEQIRLAAPMHDIGKIAIPDAILFKPGKLTPE